MSARMVAKINYLGSLKILLNFNRESEGSNQVLDSNAVI